MAPTGSRFGAGMLILQQVNPHTEIDIMAAKVETRISARVPEHVYETLTRAAELCGATVNQFLVQSALDRARAVIEEENLIRLDAESARRLFDAIENPPEYAKKYPRKVPAAKLARLAVTMDRQRQGLGGLMMVDAMRRTLAVAENIGIIGFFVDAKN